MSLRFGSLGLFFSLVAIALAANQADLEHAKSSRGPAAVAMMHKEVKLGPFKAAPLLKHTEKIRGPISVKIELLGESPRVGETFVLRGTIVSRKAMDNTSFGWSIPEGVEVVNGSLNGQVQTVSEDQPAVVELTLKKTGENNAQVHLNANAAQGDARFGDTAQFNTDVQSMLGGSKEKVLGKADAGSDKKPALKIFH